MHIVEQIALQMFTVPSIAENLIEEHNAFDVFSSFFLEQLEEQKIMGGKKNFESLIIK